MTSEESEEKLIDGHFVEREKNAKKLSLSTTIWKSEEEQNNSYEGQKVEEVIKEKPMGEIPNVKKISKIHKNGGLTKYFLYGSIVFGVLFIVAILGVILIQNGPLLPGQNNEIVKNDEALGDTEVLLDLATDSDQDTIPDDVEKAMGYDPNNNDCVREIGCGDYTNVPRAKLRLNLVFVLDASGSMKGDVNGINKWESAVSAFKSVLARGFPGYTDVGLVVYGHRGGDSSQEQRLGSCNGVEVVSQLSPMRGKNIGASVDNLTPSGWTPLAKGLATAGEMLKDRKGEGNFVILLSDGLETCDGNPVEQARNLKTSGIEVTTNVVGLAVNEEEKQQLIQIAQAGGGNYYPADDPKDLERALVLSSEVIRLWEQINKCIVDNLTKYSSCVGTQYLKSINYVKNERLKIQSEVAPQVGGTGVVDVGTYLDREEKMWSTYQQLRDDNWVQYQSDLDQLTVGD